MEYSNPKDQYEYLFPALGKGSFSTVYKAIRKIDNMIVCAKESHPIKSENEMKLLTTEFETLRNLIHPNIIQVYQAFFFDDIFCLILEYADNWKFAPNCWKNQ